MIGQKFNERYTITARVGAGAMGTVYQASDAQTGQVVALKIVSREVAINPEMLERFKREGATLRQLKHPNIVGFIDAFQHDENYVIVMEYVPGGSLYELIKAGPLPIERARQITLDLCDALIRAHRLNIVHRDIKPENILIDEDGTPKLADFGVARLSEGTRMTRSGTQVGTPYYMAPEAWEGRSLDAQADIWSLGVVLFEMLAGQVPFGGDTGAAVMNKVLTAPPPDLKKLRAEAPSSLVKVVSRMLTRDKNRRYQTMRQVAVDLESGQQAATSNPPMAARISTVKFSSFFNPRFLILAGLLIAGVIIVINFPSAPPDNGEALLSSVANSPSASPSEASGASSTDAPVVCEPPGTAPIAFRNGGKTVTGALDQEPDVIVPYFTEMSFSLWVAQLTLVGLAEWDDQSQFVPELAAEIPTTENGGISADGLTITWKLRDCLFWSDGEPLTSADVQFTWEAVMDPGNAPLSRTGYDKIESIETPDDTTVVIKFSELYAPWQTLFTQGPNNSGGILPEHILEGQTALEGNDFVHQPTVGSGPFVITDWVPGDSMTLLPNPNFYKGHAVLDQVQIRFVADSAAALAALQAGDVDWYPNFFEADIDTIKALEPDVKLTVVPGSNFEHYFFNLGRVDGVDGRGNADSEGFCPFKDVRVRHAITLGINRQAIVDSIFGGTSVIPVSLWLNTSWTNSDLTVEAYDPNVAAALLEDAGYTLGADGVRAGDCNGVNTRLSFNFETTPAPIRVEVALAVQSDLAKIGIEFKPIHTPAGTFFAQYVDGGPLATGHYDMAGYTNGFFPDPYTDSFQCESIPNAERADGSNWYHNCDLFLSDLIDSSLDTVDPTARNVILDEAQKYITENYFVIPMYARVIVYGSTPRFIFGPFGPQSDINWNAEVWDVK